MGNCNTQQGCCGSDLNEINIMEQSAFLNGKVAKLTPEDLQGKHIEIGENGFETPLARSALLQENYSHIYDRKFD